MKSALARILREPLVHFLAAGGILFAVLSAGGEEGALEAPPSNRIEITDQDAERLASRFQAAWRRPPTAEEQAGLIEEFVREEIYVREARALGLDQGDQVVRNRLRQKMVFLSQSIAGALEPDDAELEGFLRENAAKYAAPGTIAFEQVYLGNNPNAEIVKTTITALNDGAAPQSVGERTLLPSAMRPSYGKAIDGVFGSGFAASLTGLPPGEWRGPIRSGYGLHLVRVTARTEPAAPSLAQIRERVADDWRREKAEEATEQWFQARRDGYEIVLPGDSRQ